MTRKKEGPTRRMLTAVELEVMQALWDLGQGTVKDVIERLPPDRDLAYTSVATMLKILEKKRFASSRKSERAHVYLPLVTREQYQSKSLHHMVDRVFRGAPSTLVMRLIHETPLSKEELESIRHLIEERLGK
jgi:predicted transcriptional regulator